MPVWKDCLIVAATVYDDTLNGAANPWTTAMTEAYAADGATMTPAEALYMIKQMLPEIDQRYHDDGEEARRQHHRDDVHAQ